MHKVIVRTKLKTKDTAEEIESKVLYCNNGSNLLSVLQKNGIVINAVCAGNGTCKKCKINVDGNERTACDTFVNNDIEVTVDKATINSGYFIKLKPNFIGSSAKIAVDIGTTTVALAVLDEKDNVVCQNTFINPQKVYGSDVMSRIGNSPKNLHAMNQLIVKEINQQISFLKTEYNIKSIDKMVVVANTAMLHIFLNIDCSSMGYAPYSSVFLNGKIISSALLGFDFDCIIETLPCFSSFVGADVVSAVSYLGCPNSEKFNLLIDLGTNAEIVLWSAKRCISTSTAVGPCFEGANISCGMMATTGAIDTFRMENGISIYSTINDEEAKGICGSGIIDIVATLLKNNLVDETGRFIDTDSFNICNSISFTQKDLRQFQLAKSAIYTAIKLILKEYNVDHKMLENVYLSGSFANHINIKNAVICQLLPKELAEKSINIGNSALKGAINHFQFPVPNLTSDYLDLAVNSNFFNEYASNMLFE